MGASRGMPFLKDHGFSPAMISGWPSRKS
jgi:hypothetical protein